MMRRLLGMPWTILVAVCLGIVISPAAPTLWALAVAEYDSVNPVVTMAGKVVDKKPGEVTIWITGEKHRECRYMGLQAFSTLADGTMQGAYRQRLDMPESGSTRPVGKLDLGRWRIWPVGADAVSVVVYLQHECSGRIITSKVADVSLVP